MYAAAWLLFYATLFVSVCVCFERDAVVPSAVGRREGCCRIHYRCLWRENGTSIRAASFLTKIFTCRCLDVPSPEPELKYGGLRKRREPVIQILHSCHLNPSYGEPLCSFNYTEQLSKSTREGLCPLLMAPIRAREKVRPMAGPLTTALEMGLNKPYLAKAEPLACLLCKLIAGSAVLCVESLLIRAAGPVEFK